MSKRWFSPVPECWITQEGEVTPFEEMTASHLFYSLRMLYNHLAPVEMQIPGCRRYRGIREWPRSYTKRAVLLLAEHLAPRLDEFKAWQLEQLRTMVARSRSLGIAQLSGVDTR